MRDIHVAEVIEDDGVGWGSGMSSDARGRQSLGEMRAVLFLASERRPLKQRKPRAQLEGPTALHEDIMAPWYEVEGSRR